MVVDGPSFTNALMGSLDSTGTGTSTRMDLVTSEGSFGLETKRFINWLRSRVSCEWKLTPHRLEIDTQNIVILRWPMKQPTIPCLSDSILVTLPINFPIITVWLSPPRIGTMTRAVGTVLRLTEEHGGMISVLYPAWTVTSEVVTIFGIGIYSWEARWNSNQNTLDWLFNLHLDWKAKWLEWWKR